MKSPKHVAKFGMHLLGYIKNTVNWCLEYGPAGGNGMEVEVESDARSSGVLEWGTHPMGQPKATFRNPFHERVRAVGLCGWDGDGRRDRDCYPCSDW